MKKLPSNSQWRLVSVLRPQLGVFTKISNSNILTNWENNYSYDPLNRLTSVDKHDGLIKNLDDKKQEKLSIDYNYDNLGNRDSVEQTFSWTTKKWKEKEKTKIADYTNNSLNQYTEVSSLKWEGDDEWDKNHPPDKGRLGGVSLVYNKNGNLTQDSNQKYSYDYRNRLLKVLDKKDDSIRAEFRYDILGRRITRTIYNDEDEVKMGILLSQNPHLETVWECMKMKESSGLKK
jgi:hypothetical protein